jgi:DNA-binding XRE family transcriptional regulator
MMTGNQCKAARAWLGLTLDDLATLAAINRNTIHGLEAGKSAPHPHNVDAIERVFAERGVSFHTDWQRGSGLWVAKHANSA